MDWVFYLVAASTFILFGIALAYFFRFGQSLRKRNALSRLASVLSDPCSLYDALFDKLSPRQSRFLRKGVFFALLAVVSIWAVFFLSISILKWF